MESPTDLRYAQSHEWALLDDDGNVLVGITEHAQSELGDVVFVETPEVDRTVAAQEACAVVESVKAASDLYAPVSGTIIEVNSDLADSPELINESPYERGWIFKISPDDESEIEELMTASEYDDFVEHGA
ncbi:MAG: glycine cleavage system protein GcvH [Gammaproteobacteria bacterium]|nr:glycine cleavage system protein GcvH [Gammaproteobacteria bacterium]